MDTAYGFSDSGLSLNSMHAPGDPTADDVKKWLDNFGTGDDSANWLESHFNSVAALDEDAAHAKDAAASGVSKGFDIPSSLSSILLQEPEFLPLNEMLLKAPSSKGLIARTRTDDEASNSCLNSSRTSSRAGSSASADGTPFADLPGVYPATASATAAAAAAAAAEPGRLLTEGDTPVRADGDEGSSLSDEDREREVDRIIRQAKEDGAEALQQSKLARNIVDSGKKGDLAVLDEKEIVAEAEQRVREFVGKPPGAMVTYADWKKFCLTYKLTVGRRRKKEDYMVAVVGRLRAGDGDGIEWDASLGLTAAQINWMAGKIRESVDRRTGPIRVTDLKVYCEVHGLAVGRKRTKNDYIDKIIEHMKNLYGEPLGGADLEENAARCSGDTSSSAAAAAVEPTVVRAQTKKRKEPEALAPQDIVVDTNVREAVKAAIPSVELPRLPMAPALGDAPSPKRCRRLSANSEVGGGAVEFPSMDYPFDSAGHDVLAFLTDAPGNAPFADDGDHDVAGTFASLI